MHHNRKIAAALGILVAAPVGWYIAVLMTSESAKPDRKQWSGLAFYMIVAALAFTKKFLAFKNTRF